MKTRILAILIAVATLSSCATVTKLWHRPETQAGVEGLKQAVFSFAFAAATESVRQLTTTGKVDPTRVGVVGGAAALWTSANYIRQLQSTPDALSPDAVANQLSSAGISQADAQKLADAIMSNAKILTAQGIPPDAANELTAAAFDAAAKKIQEGK